MALQTTSHMSHTTKFNFNCWIYFTALMNFMWKGQLVGHFTCLTCGSLTLFICRWNSQAIPMVERLHTKSSAKQYYSWVRFYDLAQEYWRPKILFSIASSICTPICSGMVFTSPLIDRSFSHFVRVLVDMHVTKEIRYKILVKRWGYAFFTELEYENLP